MVLVIQITKIFLRCCYLQYTNSLSLENKESVILSTVIPVETSDKQEKVEVSPVFTKLQLNGPRVQP